MLQLEWVTSPKTDLIADSLSLLVLQVNEKPSPQLVNMMDNIGEQRSWEEFVKKMHIIMINHFDTVELDLLAKQIIIIHAEKQAIIDLNNRVVSSDD